MQRRGGIPFLHEMALEKAEAAARRLAAATRRERDERAKLDLLVSHGAHYRAQLADRLQTGLDPAGLGNFRRFLEKLDEAIAWQRQLILECERAAAGQRAAWDTERRRARAYEALLERRRLAERAREARAERREADARAARRPDIWE